MIGAAAEIISERMLERLPMEKAVFKVQDVASVVKEGISRNIDALALGLFTAPTMARQALNGMAVEDVKGRISEETHRIAVVREATERAAREATRGLGHAEQNFPDEPTYRCGHRPDAVRTGIGEH